MNKAVIRTLFAVLLLIGLGRQAAYAQHATSVAGMVVDSITGEPLPFVTIVFEGSTIGGVTDMDGNFQLKNDRGLTRLKISYVGYDTKTVTLTAGHATTDLRIRLAPSTIQLSEIVIRPKRERYTRKNNPAVELMKRVVARKDSNRITQLDDYSTECYEKMTLSLDKFDTRLEKSKVLKRFKFLKNYLDTSEFDGRPILTLSLREKISDIYYRREPRSEKVVVRATRQQGIDQSLDEYGTLTANLDEIFQGVDIFDNNITFLLNRFVSPLSSTLANTFYHYYIMDTVDVGGEPCTDLAFVPVNAQSYGFTGKTRY